MRRSRKRKGEVIGGGYFVYRRGKRTGRISIASKLPFEHPSFEAALQEADRLHALEPKESFGVMCEMYRISPQDFE